jgi:hypothetical protein
MIQPLPPAAVEAAAAVTARLRAGDAPELTKIHERVAKGVEWLMAHDPLGVYHLWFESGISPHQKMPSPPSETSQAEYAEYCQRRTLFEQLWTRMEKLEAIEAHKAKETP